MSYWWKWLTGKKNTWTGEQVKAVELTAEQRDAGETCTWAKQRGTNTWNKPLGIKRHKILYLRFYLESHRMRQDNLALMRGENQDYEEAVDTLMSHRCVSCLQQWQYTHKHTHTRTHREASGEGKAVRKQVKTQQGKKKKLLLWRSDGRTHDVDMKPADLKWDRLSYTEVSNFIIRRHIM